MAISQGVVPPNDGRQAKTSGKERITYLIVDPDYPRESSLIGRIKREIYNWRIRATYPRGNGNLPTAR